MLAALPDGRRAPRTRDYYRARSRRSTDASGLRRCRAPVRRRLRLRGRPATRAPRRRGPRPRARDRPTAPRPGKVATRDLNAEAVGFWVARPDHGAAALGLLFARKAVHVALGDGARHDRPRDRLHHAAAPTSSAWCRSFVYTGAVMMMFVFVLMLIGVDSARTRSIETIKGQRWASACSSSASPASALFLIGASSSTSDRAGRHGQGRRDRRRPGQHAGVAELIFGQYVDHRGHLGSADHRRRRCARAHPPRAPDAKHHAARVADARVRVGDQPHVNKPARPGRLRAAQRARRPRALTRRRRRSRSRVSRVLVAPSTRSQRPTA